MSLYHHSSRLNKMQCSCVTQISKWLILFNTLLSIVFEKNKKLVIKHQCDFTKVQTFCCTFKLLYLEAIRGLYSLIYHHPASNVLACKFTSNEWLCVLEGIKFAKKNHLIDNFGKHESIDKL